MEICIGCQAEVQFRKAQHFCNCGKLVMHGDVSEAQGKELELLAEPECVSK